MQTDGNKIHVNTICVREIFLPMAWFEQFEHHTKSSMWFWHTECNASAFVWYTVCDVRRSLKPIHINNRHQLCICFANVVHIQLRGHTIAKRNFTTLRMILPCRHQLYQMVSSMGEGRQDHQSSLLDKNKPEKPCLPTFQNGTNQEAICCTQSLTTAKQRVLLFFIKHSTELPESWIQRSGRKERNRR